MSCIFLFFLFVRVKKYPNKKLVNKHHLNNWSLIVIARNKTIHTFQWKHKNNHYQARMQGVWRTPKSQPDIKSRKKKGTKSRKLTKITIMLFTNESKMMFFEQVTPPPYPGVGHTITLGGMGLLQPNLLFCLLWLLNISHDAYIIIMFLS